jgi:large subunit ribosomal protein L2
MKLKTFTPITPSLRNLIQLNKTELTNKPLLKSKIKGLKQNSGRNFDGKITSFCKGGGHKKKYRKIEFKRTENSIGIVIGIEYDPFRSSNIASIYNFLTKTFFYIIAPKNLIIGDIIKSGINAEAKNGHSLPISKIPIGCLIHNIAPKVNSMSQISRSAGTFSQLIEKTSKFGRIKLSSGEQRTLSINCFATIGVVSNELFLLTNLGKAGRSRWLNKRPKVRGVAMNPIDHPHGGGEGKTSGGRTSVTPWCKPTKGGKTIRSKNKLIIK